MDVTKLTDCYLLDQFKFVAPCAVENDAEYMECALELAGELLNRGYVAPLVGFVRFLEERANKLTKPDGSCCHEDVCATGNHGAALYFLRRQVLSDGTPLEKSYTDAGMVLDLKVIESVEFGPFEHDDQADEVRIGYWWGNSNLYWPLAFKDWMASRVAVAT